MRDKDIRGTALYQEAESLHSIFRRPGTGLISDASELSTDGRQAIFTGTLVDRLNGAPPTRICSTNLVTGDTRVMTFGPNTDRMPKFSPDGRHIAFLSDRHKAGDFQLYLLNPVGGAAHATPPVQGWVEYLQWSPDGARILLGVAGHGADVSGAQGAITSKPVSDDVPPSWMPTVETRDISHRWRRAWVYELDTNRLRPVSHEDCNLWEAVWCGNDALGAIASPGPDEGLWYSARLQMVDVASGNARELYAPKHQLGWPNASPSGKHLAVVEAICSDRWLVAGEIRLIQPSTGQVQSVDTRGVDVSYTEWRSERHLLLAGHRDFETVVAVYDVSARTLTETWVSQDITTSGRYVTVSGLGETGDCILVGEGFARAPEIAMINKGSYLPIKSFDLGYADQVSAIAAVECLSWDAPDGLNIQGWLLRPAGNGPFPLVMNIHGGPVWHWRPTWLGRGNIHVLMLIKRGYVVFFPNPRGSAGRGQDFVCRILGDMGGADVQDYLSGLDHLVRRGIADPARLGVTGGSYGGFMTSWLITQDSRFAAAVALAPVTNHVTEYLISNIPHFVSLFLADSYNNFAGKYFSRSPVFYAHRVKTPTLNVCGALDRCTPPEEAVQFHNALLQHGVKSELIIYPEEGHGIRKWPAIIDYAVRVIGWFEEHMGTAVESDGKEGVGSAVLKKVDPLGPPVKPIAPHREEKQP